MKVRLLVLSSLFFLFAVLTYSVSGNFFFWDTIKLVSAPAHFFYDNNFSEFIVPEEFDAGHLPGFAYYLATVWNFFSKSLLVSHFAMLPFVFGAIWQGYLLIQRYVSNKRDSVIVLLLAISGPTFLSQSLMISPEVPLLFFFLLGINMLYLKKDFLFSIALLGLLLMSSRGVILIAALLILEVLGDVHFSIIKTVVFQLLKKSVKYLPALFLLVGYQLYHYKTTGWVFSHEDSPWAEGRIGNDFSGAIYNSTVFVWRMLDFGRVVIYIPLLILLIRYRKNIFSNKKAKSLIIFLGAIVVLFVVLFMKYKYLTGHRYLLPLYFLLSIFTGYLVVSFVQSKKIRTVIFSVFFIGLLSGNFWVYPNKVAQGWDATLAHLPYYPLQNKMLTYLESENISINEVGSEFPNLGEQRYIMLNDDSKSFKQKDVGQDSYILYSNINNDFTDEEFDLLESTYTLKKEFQSFQVFVRLYEK